MSKPVVGSASTDAPSKNALIAEGAKHARVEAGALGAASAELVPLLDEDADCLEYADFCDHLSEGSLRLLTYSLPPGDADLLVRFYNNAYDYGAAPEQLRIDGLRVEPPPPVR